MEDDLLDNARRQAEKADASIRAAALLRIARAESVGDLARAREVLLEGLDAIQKLLPAGRVHLLDEARSVAAAVSPEMLAKIPETLHFGPPQFASGHIVETMLAHGHCEAAFHYLIHHDDPDSFPFLSVGSRTTAISLCESSGVTGRSFRQTKRPPWHAWSSSGLCRSRTLRHPQGT
jgi:hypothetical protein